MLSPYDQAVKDIIATGQRLDARGLAPATAGNYSVRLKDGRAAITVSGRHKGRLSAADIMLVDADGKALEDKKPSAETLLHAHIYKLFPDATAILHVHSVACMALTRFSGVKEFVLENYELLKIFPNTETHDVRFALPVAENSQDMSEIIAEIDVRLKKPGAAPAYIIRNHGFYAWGRNMAEAEHIVEALEHLFQCELEIAKLKAGARS